MNRNKKKGFTIVELVIVIAVIGILSAVLIPVFSNVVDNANRTAKQLELTNTYTQYVNDLEDANELVGKEDVYLVKMADQTVQEVWKANASGVWVAQEATVEGLEAAAGLPANYVTTAGYKVYVAA